MKEKDDSKFLYFDNEELEKEETENKQVFVTKRLAGKETHNIKKQIKVEKNNKSKSKNIEFDKKNKNEKQNTITDELVIDIPLSLANKQKNNNRKKEEKKVSKKGTQKNIGNKNKEKEKNSKKKNNSNKVIDIEINKTPKSNKNTKKKNNTKKKKKKNILGKIFTIIILIVAVTIITFITPIFNISKIEVDGNQKITEQTIISLSGLKKGENIFKNLKSNIIKNIKENNYIEDVQIKRILPGTIRINITEREIKYQIKVLESYAYIDKQGYILEISKEMIQVPIIEGSNTKEEDILKDKRLDEKDLLKLKSLQKIINLTKEMEIEEEVNKINITDSKEYILYIGNKQIYLGDDLNLNNKMGYIKMILNDVGEKEGTIFVNGDFNDGFKAYFRPQE